MPAVSKPFVFVICTCRI